MYFTRLYKMIPATLNTEKTQQEFKAQSEYFRSEVKRRSDRLMNFFLLGFFIIGFLLAPYFDTWVVALGVGGLSLVAYYTVKWLLPHSDLYQYVLSVVLALFMAQYIYQMHGLFEMHFFAFIGCAVLITYQNWKLQIPLLIFVVAHHSIFNYLQFTGNTSVFFTRLDYLDWQTYVIHLILTTIIVFICGLWAYQLRRSGEIQIAQTVKMIALQDAEKARDEAERANKAKSIFLATMSHEIRTPMNGVLGMASLLAETPLTEQQRTYTETIAICGDTLLNVINDILDFSKIESGSMELEEEDFNLQSSIEHILDLFGARAARTGIELLNQVEHDVPANIRGDDLRLRQILTNLVGNAMKFTEQGEIFIGVKVQEKAGDGALTLAFEVRDTGIGIPADKLARLFKAFSQVDSSTTRKYGGTGLGLAISEQLIRLMGGSIRVESTPGKGSTFFFTIRTQIGAGSQPTLPALSDQAGKKVLIVDDNGTNRTILTTQLEYWNLRPTPVASGVEALNILAGDDHYDLVLTDMRMPFMDGIRLAETVRHRHPHIPIILLSSVGDEYKKDRPQVFHAVMTKPIKQQVLHRHVLTGLQRRGSIHSESRSTLPRLPEKLASTFPLNILIAEDNLINQQVIYFILQKLGYEPLIVENGQQAVTAALNTGYDIIFMDLQMPEMDGLEATRLIRRSRLVDQPVIIALTANTMEGDQEECLQMGMNDFVGKPVKLEELVGKLRKWALHRQLS
jgi:two-component system sensor histidine kinase/response regulator